jgi:hypothetical protein
MKLGEFKIIGRKTKVMIQLAYKNKNGLLFTITDNKPQLMLGGGFTFYLGKEFTQVTLYSDHKGEYLELVQPAKDEQIRIKLVDRDHYQKFLATDYNGKNL